MADQQIMDGGCLCGDVRYRITGPSLFVMQCCCKDCQKATGAGHTTIVGIERAQIDVKGDVTTYTTTGDTGGDVTRHFCGRCGGRLYTSGTLPGTVVMVQAGSLDQPELISPERAIYTKDALPWDKFDPALPQHPGLSPRFRA